MNEAYSAFICTPIQSALQSYKGISPQPLLVHKRQRRTVPRLSLVLSRFFFFLHWVTWWSFRTPLGHLMEFFGSLPLLPLACSVDQYWPALPNVDVFPLRSEHCFYVLIDTVKLLWCNLYCEKRYRNILDLYYTILDYPLDFILICCLAAQETFIIIIINVENSYAISQLPGLLDE